MHSIREALDIEWESLGHATDLPTAVLYGLVLTVAHTANHIPWESVRVAFKETLGGPPKERKVWKGVEMQWCGGKVPVQVRAKRNQIRVLALNRVTPSRLKRLMRALLDVPHTGKVRLRAQVERFATDGEEPSMG